MRKSCPVLIFCLVLMLAAGACTGVPDNPAQTPGPAMSTLPSLTPSITTASQPVTYYSYKIVNVYPHDTTAFTQGLVIDGGFLYEGTGMYGESSIRRLDLESGEVLQSYRLSDEYWGEGITIFGDSLIQLTYKSRKGFVYDKNSFELTGRFSYPTEGWGITHDGKRLIMSDGTSRLYFRDPGTFELAGQVEVTYKNSPVTGINELEYINGRVYANIWPTNRIAIIEPEDGRVSGWIELSGILQTQAYKGRVDVLNGIAWDTQNNRLFIAGKWWPFLFEIRLVALSANLSLD